MYETRDPQGPRAAPALLSTLALHVRLTCVDCVLLDSVLYLWQLSSSCHGPGVLCGQARCGRPTLGVLPVRQLLLRRYAARGQLQRHAEAAHGDAIPAERSGMCRALRGVLPWGLHRSSPWYLFKKTRGMRPRKNTSRFFSWTCCSACSMTACQRGMCVSGWRLRHP